MTTRNIASENSASQKLTKERQQNGRDSGRNPEIHQQSKDSFDDYNSDDKPVLDKRSHSEDLLLKTMPPADEFGSRKFTRRQIIILVVFCFTEFCTGAVGSLQAPFYPAEAEKKGVTASEYGAVFGIFEFTVFAVSFLYGKYMSTIGPKVVYNAGLFLTGLCSILFGFLDRFEDRTTFFALSMVMRIIEAVGTAGCLTAAFTIIALEFPGSVATTFATMEMLYALGLTCGPVIGGGLFEIGGFYLPFLSTGVLMILTATFSFFVLPTSKDSNEEESSKGLLQLLKIPEVGLSTFVIFSAALSIGHLNSTLEPHIREFNLSSIVIGIVIAISGATYALLAPVWGKLCDWKPNLNFYMILGSVIIIIGFLLIGPVPFLPFNTILWVTCVGLVLHGIGLGGSLVSSFIQCLASANANGFPDNVSTYSRVGGIWASFFSLGNFVGPTLSGVLYDSVGFRNGTLFVIGLHIIVIIALTSLITFGAKSKPGSRRRLREFSESEPLLLGT